MNALEDKNTGKDPPAKDFMMLNGP